MKSFDKEKQFKIRVENNDLKQVAHKNLHTHTTNRITMKDFVPQPLPPLFWPGQLRMSCFTSIIPFTISKFLALS